MILVDTCGWIERLTDGALADSFASYMLPRTIVSKVWLA